MRNVKTYEDFCNEEINWKKGIAGAAIGAGLAFGSPAKGQSSPHTPNEPPKKVKQDTLSVRDKVSKMKKFKYRTIPADVNTLSEIPEEDVQLTIKKPIKSDDIAKNNE